MQPLRFPVIFLPLLLLCAETAVADDEPPPLFDRRGERVLRISPQPSTLFQRGEPTIRVVSPSGASNEGNVTVLIEGTAFRNYGDVKVRFCSVDVRGYVLNEGAITTVAPPLSSMPAKHGFTPSPVQSTACKVDLTLNGVDYTTSTGVFWYYNKTAMSIARMRPSGGPVAGGTAVRLEGVGFIDLGGGVQGPKCRFGDVVVAATVESHHTARCLSPPLAEPVPVWLTLNGYTDERSLVGGMTFRFAAPPTLSELHPIGGPSFGGAYITVYGQGFVDDGERTSACAIGDAMRCRMHAQAVGLLFVDQPRHGFRCVFGERGAADVVAVQGTLQGGGEQLRCQTPTDQLLDRLSTGSVGPWCARHGNTTSCNDPAYASSALTAVEIRVTTNAISSDASPTAVVYMPLAPHLPSLQHVQPWGGPASGGTIVSIVGEQLLSLTERRSPLCRFGHVEVPAVVGGRHGSPALLSAPLHDRVTLHDARSPRTVAVHTGRLVTCTSPPGHVFGSRWARISVALDGVHFSADTLAFRFTELRLDSIYPTGGFLVGGTRVIVYGNGFADFGGLRCVFGDVSVPATLDGSFSLHCVSPAVAVASTVTLSVSVNGDLDSRSLESGNATFAYFDQATVMVSSLSPALGTIFGGTAVTVRGVGFAEYGTVQCKFGQHAAVNATYRRSVDTPIGLDRIPLDEVVCYTPAHPMGHSLETEGGDQVPFALSLTGDLLEFTQPDPLTFVYHHPCRGRVLLDYYAETGARDAVSQYLSANAPNLTHFDANGNGRLEAVELQEAIRYSRDNTTASRPNEAALRDYAESTCFLEHEADGRELSVSPADEPRDDELYWWQVGADADVLA